MQCAGVACAKNLFYYGGISFRAQKRNLPLFALMNYKTLHQNMTIISAVLKHLQLDYTQKLWNCKSVK